MSKGITNKTFKNIFIYLLPFLSISYLIINSTQFKVLKHKIKTNLMPRNLEESAEKSTKICDKISTKLEKYFKTGDKSELGLEEDNTEEYGQYYIKALINIVKHYYEEKEKKQTSNTRILDGDDGSTGYMKNLFKYAYHILPLLVVFGIGVLSLVGWLICCCCTCYKCKCCVCKKPKCKTPSTVLAIISYAIVALISFYALTEQSKIFSGLADTECSVLKFTDEVLYGENIKYPPYWAGIDKIDGLLNEIKEKTMELKSQEILTQLNGVKADAIGTDGSGGQKGIFEGNLRNAKNIYTSGNYIIDGYQLDIARQFGDESNPNSVYSLWMNEYDSIYTNSKQEMEDASEYFRNIFNNLLYDKFDIGKEKIQQLKKDFLSLKKLIADEIIDKADDVDKKGKLVYTLFFIFLMLLCAAIVVFMLLLCCCSGELCTNLSCCQCFCKFFLHFFWNLMAFIMFVLFMGGSMFTISGTTGGDLVKVVSYLISEDNLGPGKDTIILGKVKQYLNQCFNHEGNILEELGLDENSMEPFEKLKESQIKLEEYKNQFKDLLFKFVYSEYKEELEQRINYETSELILKNTNGGQDISFNEIINEYNNEAENKNERWVLGSTSSSTCNNDPHTEFIEYNPKTCYPADISGYTSLSAKATQLNYIRDLINKAKNEDDNDSIINILKVLSDKYDAYLKSEIVALNTYIGEINKITEIVNKYTSEDGELFSFMNCGFIKDNVQVILFYLKNSFQNDMYEVGVYLLIAAFSMPFGISFTILLIMISNEEVETNKKKEEDLKKRKSQVDINPPNEIKVENNNDNGNTTEQRRLNQNN